MYDTLMDSERLMFHREYIYILECYHRLLLIKFSVPVN